LLIARGIRTIVFDPASFLSRLLKFVLKGRFTAS
jgi:hypothetical protein